MASSGSTAVLRAIETVRDGHADEDGEVVEAAAARGDPVGRLRVLDPRPEEGP